MNSTAETGASAAYRARWLLLLGIALWIGLLSTSARNQSHREKSDSSQEVPGQILPLPEPEFTGKIGKSYLESDPAYPPLLLPAENAPNIVLIVLDDVGYGQCGTFGGAIPTPNLDRLAREGIRFTRFHTTGLCSPTRAALLTGRNHHSCGMGVIEELALGYPGYNGIIPGSCATVAEIFRQHGYSTAAIGKWHNTPEWEAGPAGPFDRWPTGQGFQQFYGFLGAGTNQWSPNLFDDTTPVPSTDRPPDYHLTTDLTNRAVEWVQMQRSLAPGRPFFLYFATGATHAPHHVPREWIDRFRGQFDDGWDHYRQSTFERQKQLGAIPQDTLLTERPTELPAWDSLSMDEKKIASRLMEVYAGYTAHTDYELGRLLEGLERTGDLDNTLLMCLVGDNGASGEGGLAGLANDLSIYNFRSDSLELMLGQIDEFGGPRASCHFPAAWAWAMNTPFQWTKQIASHLGATRNPLLVRWPRHIKTPGSTRGQFLHVIDIAPTLLAAAGLPEPAVVNGTRQKPFEGTSFMPVIDDPEAPECRRSQYFEIVGNCAMYHEGWMASCMRSVPWNMWRGHIDIDSLPWELYHLDNDFSQARNLAAEYPEKLKQLKQMFWKEAARYQVLPIEDRGAQRLFADFRPGLLEDRQAFVMFQSVAHVPEGAAPQLRNHSHRIVADIDMPASDASGMLITQGGRFGGWGLYLLEGRVQYVYNLLNQERFVITSTTPVPMGHAEIRFEFTYDGLLPGRGGTGALWINGQLAGEGRFNRTMGYRLTSTETFDIGIDTGTPVAEDYECPFRFPGNLGQIRIDLKPR